MINTSSLYSQTKQAERIERECVPQTMHMTDLNKEEILQKINTTVQSSRFGLSTWQTSFLNYLESTLKDKNCFSMFLNLQELADLSITSRAMYQKCNQIWLAFASPQRSEDIPIESLLPKWIGFDASDSLRNRKEMLTEVINRKISSINLFNVLHASSMQLITAGFLHAAKIGNLNALDLYLNFYKVPVTQLFDEHGETALTTATRTEQYIVVKKILTHLKKQNPKTNPDYHSRKEEILTFIDARNRDGKSALEIAQTKLKLHEAKSPCCYYTKFHKDLKNLELLVSMSALPERIKWKLYTPLLVCTETCCLGYCGEYAPLSIYDMLSNLQPKNRKTITACCTCLCMPIFLVYAIPVSCCFLHCDFACEYIC